MNSNQVIIAIDPGASGGIAICDSQGTVSCHKRPETPKDTHDLIAAARDDAYINSCGLFCYMEQVSGYAGEAQPGSAMFNFGRGYGQLEGFLIALKIPFETVVASKWQRAIGVLPSGRQRAIIVPGMTESDKRSEKARVSKMNSQLKQAHKNRMKERAQRLFPHLKVTLATSDALLILDYGLRARNIPIPQAVKQEALL